MKLTQEDQQLLKEIGHLDDDFPQIKLAMQNRYTKYRYQNKYISRERAIQLLGRRKYICGLSRSAFHWSAAQVVGACNNPEDGVVYFDSRNLFL